MKKIDKAMKNENLEKFDVIWQKCPSDYGMKEHENCGGCEIRCSECWSEEVEDDTTKN